LIDTFGHFDFGDHVLKQAPFDEHQPILHTEFQECRVRIIDRQGIRCAGLDDDLDESVG
jgi:hypothetical protein